MSTAITPSTSSSTSTNVATTNSRPSSVATTQPPRQPSTPAQRESRPTRSTLGATVDRVAATPRDEHREANTKGARYGHPSGRRGPELQRRHHRRQARLPPVEG